MNNSLVKGTTGKGAESRVYAKITRRLIPFLILCYFFAYLDRVNVGFAKLHMQDALNFSDTVYGLGAGIFLSAIFCLRCPATSSCSVSGRASGSPASW